MITKQTVQYIASLSRLHLDETQTVRIAKDLENILSYVDQLNKLDVSSVKPTSHVLDVKDVFRPDEVRPSLSQKEAMSFAIDSVKGCYKVPKVIE